MKSSAWVNLEPGKYEIDGEDVYAVISHYDTKPITSGKWEAHKKYLDIQYIIEGKEKLGYSFSNKMIVTEEYKEYGDIMFLKGEGNFLTAEAGYFIMFFPTDIHMPGIAINLSTPVKKLVIKVRVDEIVETAKPVEKEVQTANEPQTKAETQTEEPEQPGEQTSTDEPQPSNE